MKTVISSNGYRFIIDDADFHIILKYRTWHARVIKGRVVSVNSIDRIAKKTVSLHRLILSATEKQSVDHINRDPLDNRRSNLRFANQSQNCRNRSKIRKTTTSKYKGVSYRKDTNKWVARVRTKTNGKEQSHFYMCFNTEQDAALAYNLAAQKIFGEFACLNVL